MKQRMRRLCLAIGWVWLTSCSTTPSRHEEPKSLPAETTEFSKIKTDSAHVKPEASIKQLTRFLSTHPNKSEATDQARLMLGQLYFQKQDYKDAHSAFIKIISSDVASPYENEALLMSAKSLFHMGRYDEALELDNRALHKSDLTPDQTLDLHELHFVICNQLGNRIDALQDLVFLSTQHPEADKRERYRLKGIELIESKLNDSELQRVSKGQEFGYLQGHASYRIGMIAFEQRNPARTREFMQLVQSQSPGTDLANRAQQVLNQVDARRRVNSSTIGVVLPLTGKYQSMGYRTLHGIQLALDLFKSGGSNYRLAVVDSEGNPDVARRAIDQLVTEDSVIAVIGGLLSKTASAESAKAQELGVPMIALSQSAGVTEIGNGIFRNALTSQMQVRRLVSIAMDKLGMRKFAILFPTDAYGTEFSNLFWDEVQAHGGQVVGAQSYDPKETDFRVAIQKLVGTYFQDDRSDEYRLRLKEWQDKQPRKTNKPPPDNLLPPVVGLDALFIPDNARAVGQIAPMLAYNDVDHARLIGTNLWNTPDFVKRGQKFVESAIFVDSLMENDVSLKGSKFYSDFKQVFQEEPGLFELQAYDSALILRQVLTEGASSRQDVNDGLAKLKNFPGALGPLSMTESREILRPMVSLTVQKGEITKTDF